jgi:glycerol-3-phosphate acyltransferase PlsY
MLAVWIPLAYLLGTFPSAVMVARSKGIDITSVGSKNPGASNIARVMGRWWGVAVFILDGLKGAIPAAVGLILDHRGWSYWMLGAATLGHMFPITRRFRGGKGVATVGGGMLVLHSLVSICLLGAWLAIRKLSGTASLASILITMALPLAVLASGAEAWQAWATAALGVLVMLRHVENIKRLVGGRELSADKVRT